MTTEMPAVLEIIRKTTEFFERKGISSPRLNAELIIGHVLGLKRMQLYLEFERPLTAGELDAIRPLVRRRGLHEPVQYVLGETEFYGLRLKVDPRALIPRPETERLIEIVVAGCRQPPASILELGTGSGAIALSLAHAYPAASITATDIDPKALALADENARAMGVVHRIRFVQSDWFSALSAGMFDLIVSNPPYLSAGETARTPVEVRDYEPSRALTAGEDGTADLRTIIEAAGRFLAAGGLMALETGSTQHPRLLEFLLRAGFTRSESHQDLAGRDRFLLARV